MRAREPRRLPGPQFHASRGEGGIFSELARASVADRSSSSSNMVFENDSFDINRRYSGNRRCGRLNAAGTRFLPLPEGVMIGKNLGVRR